MESAAFYHSSNEIARCVIKQLLEVIFSSISLAWWWNGFSDGHWLRTRWRHCQLHFAVATGKLLATSRSGRVRRNVTICTCEFPTIKNLLSETWYRCTIGSIGFWNIYNLLSPGGDCLLVFIPENPWIEICKRMALTSKWSPYMANIQKMKFPYQYSETQVDDFKEILNTAGFNDYQVTLDVRQYVFDGKESLKGKFG